MNETTRRRFLTGTAGAATALAGAETLHGAARKPNLVYVFADQLRYQSCGYGGDEFAQTPTIDRLAGQGLSFRNAVSSSPVCAAYRSSLLTGKYVPSTGMAINELRLSPEHEFIGQVLTRGGYQCDYIGKWHLWGNTSGHQKPVNGFVPPGRFRFGFDGFWAAYNFNHISYKAPYYRDTTERLIHPGYEADSQTDMAIQQIHQAAGRKQPFALFLSWGAPHDPWSPENTPPEYAAKFKDVNITLRPNYSGTQDPYADGWANMGKKYPEELPGFMRNYYAQTARLDWNLARVLKALDDEGVANDTIFVFTSDHGEMFGSHGRRAKLTFYEEAARVPFLIRAPGRIRPGRVSDACIGTPDIMPTLLGMMGLPIPSAVEGTDLSRHVLGKGGKEPDAAYLQGMGTTARWSDGNEWRAVRDRQYTYAIYRRDGSELLFDNVADPYQMKNLAGERAHSSKLAHFREKLKKWRKDHNDTFESCTWYRDNWTVDRTVTNTASGVKQNPEESLELIKKYFPAG